MVADASDASGQAIVRVEFYANGTLLHTDTEAPYAFSWSGAPIGTHTLLAKVVNAIGIVGASAPLTGHLEPPPLVLSLNPESPAATIAAQLRIEGLANCGTIGLNFGDGTSDTFQGEAGQPIIGQRAWASPGTFTITAIGHGDQCQSRGTLTITVGPAPPFAVAVLPGSPVAGSPATVTVTGPGTCTNVRVNYGDGAEDNDASLIDRGLAVASLASEILSPISGRDAQGDSTFCHPTRR